MMWIPTAFKNTQNLIIYEFFVIRWLQQCFVLQKKYKFSQVLSSKNVVYTHPKGH